MNNLNDQTLEFSAKDAVSRTQPHSAAKVSIHLGGIKTDSGLNRYVIINLHAAASDAGPTSPAPSPIILPQSSDLIGSQFIANLSEYLYTPINLRDDRTNLNSSWYIVPELYRPVDGYYETEATQG